MKTQDHKNVTRQHSEVATGPQTISPHAQKVRAGVVQNQRPGGSHLWNQVKRRRMDTRWWSYSEKSTLSAAVCQKQPGICCSAIRWKSSSAVIIDPSPLRFFCICLHPGRFVPASRKQLKGRRVWKHVRPLILMGGDGLLSCWRKKKKTKGLCGLSEPLRENLKHISSKQLQVVRWRLNCCRDSVFFLCERGRRWCTAALRPIKRLLQCCVLGADLWKSLCFYLICIYRDR